MSYCFNPSCQEPQNYEPVKFCHNCGSTLLLQNSYRAIKLIGKSRLYRTFLGLNETQSIAHSCVIKQLLTQTQALNSSLFAQEALQLKALGEHSQIPKLIAQIEQEKYYYLIQEFIAGKNLASVVETEGTFTEEQIWQLLNNLLPVLKFIHEHQVIHQDIKPANIIRSQADGSLVIVGLGGGTIFTTIGSLSAPTIIGSPEYIAPEQVKGKAVFASDLYSLGVTCIYLLTGISPFELRDRVNNCWVWRDYVIEQVSDRLTQVLNKLLENELNQRFQSADEVMQALGIKSAPILVKKISKTCVWQCQRTLTAPAGFSGGVNSVAISPNNQIIVSGNEDKAIRLWDLTTGALISNIYKHSSAVNSVTFNPDGKMLATASGDRTITLWKVSPDWTLEEICTLTGHQSAVKSVAFSPDGQILASGSWDKTVKLWDVNTQRLIDTLIGHTLQVTSVTFSPNGEFLASASFDRTVRIWQLKSSNFSQTTRSKIRPPFGGSSGVSLNRTLVGHTWSVLSVAFSPDGKTLATGSDDCTVQLWNFDSGQVTHSLLSHSWSVVAVAFSPDGEMLISGSADKTLKLWQVSTGQEICTLSGHSDTVCAVGVTSATGVIASGSKDKTIKLWQQNG